MTDYREQGGYGILQAEGVLVVTKGDEFAIEVPDVESADELAVYGYIGCVSLSTVEVEKLRNGNFELRQFPDSGISDPPMDDTYLYFNDEATARDYAKQFVPEQALASLNDTKEELRNKLPEGELQK